MSQQFGIIPDYPTRPIKQIDPYSVNSTVERFTIDIIKKIADDTIIRQLSLWPEEEQALEDIQTGKTKMINQTGEEFLKELNELVNGT